MRGLPPGCLGMAGEEVAPAFAVELPGKEDGEVVRFLVIGLMDESRVPGNPRSLGLWGGSDPLVDRSPLCSHSRLEQL